MSKIVRNGAPTSTTPGILGQEYYDKDTGKSYICTSVNYDPDDEIGEIDGTYVWEESSGASSWNDLTDKPFGTELYEAELEVTTEELIANNNTVLLENFPKFAVGDTVTIKVDGTEYSLLAYDSGGVPAIGDNPDELFGGNPTLGWALAYRGDICIFVANAGHTVSWQSEIINTIDPKYIYPDTTIANVISPYLRYNVDLNLLVPWIGFTQEEYEEDIECPHEIWEKLRWVVDKSCTSGLYDLCCGLYPVTHSRLNNGRVTLHSFEFVNGCLYLYTTIINYNYETSTATMICSCDIKQL